MNPLPRHRLMISLVSVCKFLFLSGTLSAQSAAPLTVAPIFGDHMVLQQQKPAKVWGTAQAGDMVTVRFDGQAAEAVADGGGKWMAVLKPMTAKPVTEQQSQELTIESTGGKLVLKDVLIGEVWLGSGQSNMNRETSAAKAAAMKPVPGLRIMGEESAPKDENKKGKGETIWRWKSLDKDPKEATGFSTMMLPFGLRLVSELQVPVGVMVGAAGGTDSGRWLAPGAGTDPELLRVAALYEKRYPEFQKQYEVDAAELAKENADWEARLLPFLRKHWAFLTKLDAKGAMNPDIAKFVANGGDINKINKLSELNKDQRRLLDDGLTPLIKSTGPEAEEGLALVDDFVRASHPERLDLKPFWLSWHYGWGLRHPMPLEPKPPGAPKKPGAEAGDLFTNHIAPLVPYTIRGILWDQGESGTGIPGIDQFTLMSALIKSWRARWNDELPWIYVQKPSGEGCRLAYEAKDEAVPFQAKLPEFIPDPNWGLYREIHIRIMANPKTYFVASSDLGPGVHPQDKDRYGTRAAEVALSKVYGKKIQATGPIYLSSKVNGNKMRITFSEVGQRLVAAHAEYPQGFAIAGADKKFHWADARIVSPDTVELSSDQVKEPVAARYAYGYAIPWANLFSKDGLPAPTFRTDNWTWEGENPVFIWKLFFTSMRRENWVWNPASAGTPTANTAEKEGK